MQFEDLSNVLQFETKVEDHWEAVATAADISRRRVTAAQAERIVEDARASIEPSEAISVQFGEFGSIAADRASSPVDFALLKVLGYFPGAKTQIYQRGAQQDRPPRSKFIPGKNLPEAIKFRLEDDGSAVIYCDDAIIGPIGDVLEFGLFFRGRQFPRHPFLRPAMARNLPDFAQQFTTPLFDLFHEG
jgi:hypothetical protein